MTLIVKTKKKSEPWYSLQRSWVWYLFRIFSLYHTFCQLIYHRPILPADPIKRPLCVSLPDFKKLIVSESNIGKKYPPIYLLHLLLVKQVHFTHDIYMRNLQLNHRRQCRQDTSKELATVHNKLRINQEYTTHSEVPLMQCLHQLSHHWHVGVQFYLACGLTKKYMNRQICTLGGVPSEKMGDACRLT